MNWMETLLSIFPLLVLVLLIFNPNALNGKDLAAVQAIWLAVVCLKHLYKKEEQHGNNDSDSTWR